MPYGTFHDTQLVSLLDNLFHGARNSLGHLAGREERRRDTELTQQVEQRRQPLLDAAIAAQKWRAVRLEIDREGHGGQSDTHGRMTMAVRANQFVRSFPHANSKFDTRSAPIATRAPLTVAPVWPPRRHGAHIFLQDAAKCARNGPCWSVVADCIDFRFATYGRREKSIRRADSPSSVT
jgi:hypothetical protein